MGLFSRKKMNNAAAIAPVMPGRPMPGPTTIHNHSASWAGIIAVGFVCFLMLFPVFWWALVFLFDQMGAQRPEREAAFWIITIPALFIGGWLIKWLLLAVLDSWFSFRIGVEREKTEQVRAQLLTAQTTIDPGRMNEEDYQFAQVIVACMMNAYQWLEKEGTTKFPSRWRPWSLASARDTANEIGIKLTQDRANEVSKWLADKGVITHPTSGQIAGRFPDLSSVRALIDREFGAPIKMVSPAIRDNRGFKFTN